MTLGALSGDPSNQTNQLLNQTNTLLALLVLGTNITNLPQLSPSPSPSPGLVRQNCFFFASLLTSLLAAAGAVVAKEWLANYERTGQTGSLEEQGLRRTAKAIGAEKWKLQQVVEALPGLILISLGLFFIAMVDYVSSVNMSVAIVIIVFSGVGTLSYLGMLLSAAFFPDCPYRTSSSRLVAAFYGLLREWTVTILIGIPRYSVLKPLLALISASANAKDLTVGAVRKVANEGDVTRSPLLENGLGQEEGAAVKRPRRRERATRLLEGTMERWEKTVEPWAPDFGCYKGSDQEDSEDRLAESALSVIRIAPRRDVFLAVAWIAPGLKHKNLLRIFQHDALLAFANELHTALSSAPPNGDDPTLALIRVLALAVVTDSSTRSLVTKVNYSDV